jgi:CRISPR-associated protein Cas1
MMGRIIEVASDGRYLHAYRGFMVVRQGDQELARVAIDDIAAVIGNAHGLTWSNELLVRLAERGAPLVLVNRQHRPIGLLLGLEGHHRQGHRLVRQAELKRPQRKRLWKRVVQAKLLGQARTLEAFGASGKALRRLALGVRSGDPDNREAQGARAYWPLLLGAGFRRNPDAGGINALLNYGYTILRAAVARCIVAAGLHPTLGIQHRNEFNSAALADDLMEPFRPLIDACVRGLVDRGIDDVGPESKRLLALCLYRAIATDAGASPITTAVERLCLSLAQVVEGERQHLELPGELSPQALRSLGRSAAAPHGKDEEE